MRYLWLLFHGNFIWPLTTIPFLGHTTCNPSNCRYWGHRNSYWKVLPKSNLPLGAIEVEQYVWIFRCTVGKSRQLQSIWKSNQQQAESPPMAELIMAEIIYGWINILCGADAHLYSTGTPQNNPDLENLGKTGKNILVFLLTTLDTITGIGSCRSPGSRRQNRQENTGVGMVWAPWLRHSRGMRGANPRWIPWLCNHTKPHTRTRNQTKPRSHRAMIPARHTRCRRTKQPAHEILMLWTLSSLAHFVDSTLESIETSRGLDFAKHAG